MGEVEFEHKALVKAVNGAIAEREVTTADAHVSKYWG